MRARLGLRLRVFLFFAALGVGGAALLAIGLVLGFRHAAVPAALPGFVTAGMVGGFGLVGLTALVWLVFDERVARPIQRLAADLRVRAHSSAAGDIDHAAAHWLGDLVPAASAVTAELGRASGATARTVAEQTARLEREKARLQAILEKIPVGIVLMSADMRLVLYDGHAAGLLGRGHPLGLDRPIGEWLDTRQLKEARRALEHAPGNRHVFRIADADGTRVFEATIRSLGPGAGYMLSLETSGLEALERPLVFDFDLIDRATAERIHDTRLQDLAYVVFDTETTGLSPERDDVVQIGAVRIVNERLVAGEVIDTLVDPGRPIPPSSTRIHRIDDAMVRGAPGVEEACRRFDRFARGAVLVAHNAAFDVAMLRKCGVAPFDHPVLDTVLLSAEIFGTEAEHTLDAIAARLGVEIPQAARHTALGDALATAEVLRRMLPMLRARGLTTFGDVVAAMRRHTALVPDLNKIGTSEPQTS